ncbi:MAG: xanthine dehydrogenase family protein molybdopterin-binding subunit [Candidatus Afipia apatlaquensis]|uniref:Xanthine dehydrogenase family protein molybdopterin-binding subunit n=1 Tax=Candidatus Afipia apatlaquensis TaxID=2712852 RepID=A0A7C9RK66_9BRAD|nr:xanthine dehydrogenase family protein molybdopterin-binding subunit [Candidatus Afipia apatlaquensis]
MTQTSPASSYTGRPISRVDGRAKVTGSAKYAGDFNADNMVYGFVVESTVTRGRIKQILVSEALRVPGVLAVITHENRPQVADSPEAWKDEVAPEEGQPFRPLYDDQIWFNGQPIALVLAEEWEIARYAASLIRVDYEARSFVTDLRVRLDAATTVDRPAKPRGDAAKAFAAAEVRHQADYYIPTEHHNPIELFATTAMWDGDGKLTVHDKTQGVQNVSDFLASAFKKNKDDFSVVSPFVGGAFGSGLRPQYQVVLAVMGALKLERSVRLVLTRQQMYGLGYRPPTIERLALGAKKDGTLDAVTHEAIGATSEFEDFSRNDAGWSAQLYKSANASYAQRIVHLDRPTSCDMRAPGAATGVYGLESAMDELAVALKMDPVELRLRCYSDRDQNEDVPFTSKALRDCYRQAAEAFGWSKRSPEPRSMRDGNNLVGWGMASGIWEALQMPMAVRIVMTANGYAEVSCAASDIGPGTYTVMSQVAADSLGLPIENVTIKLGDSTLPKAPVEGGSWMAASSCHAVLATADEVRKELLEAAKKMPDTPLAGVPPEDVALFEGKLVSRKDAARVVSVADVMQHGGLERIEKEKTNEFKEDGKYSKNTHSAVFVEVKVDEQLGVIRVTRVVSAIAAGRVVNPKTGGSQIMGAIVGGIGMALQEETVYDHGIGRIINANIAEYHVPVNADINDIQVIFVDEKDTLINPLGMKGLGEIGIVGVAAAVANAVYHATGVRVRDLPITLDKVLARGGAPAAA